MGNKYVVVDLETTGNAPKKGDKIIQFAAVVIENGIITEQYSSLINPEQSIPPFIEELTGLPVIGQVNLKAKKTGRKPAGKQKQLHKTEIPARGDARV